MTTPQLPSESNSSAEESELAALVTKVREGGTLNQTERQRFFTLAAKADPVASASSTPASFPPDPVPVTQDEGRLDKRPTAAQQSARVQIVVAWLHLEFTTRAVANYAAKRWGLAPRTADNLIAAAKAEIAAPVHMQRELLAARQRERLVCLYVRRLHGEENRDPLEPLKELAKLCGLNAPAQTEVRQKISLPDPAARAQFFIPNNGRSRPPAPAGEAS